MGTEGIVTLDVARARELAAGAFFKAGLSEADAAAVADVLVEAELAGRPGHGLLRVEALCKQPPSSAASVTVTSEGPAWAAVDAGGRLGYLATSEAVDMACDRAEAAGIGMVGVKRTTHAGFMGYYARRASSRGLIGFICGDTHPRIAPTGSNEALLGTNPITVAVPAEPADVVIDLSTAAVTIGELLVLKALGASIPPGLAFDVDGAPADDPEKALAGAVVPFGGPKGYCLALIVQIASAALTGADLFPGRGGDYGLFVAALDPGLFTSREDFAARMVELRERMAALRTESADGTILLPGERAWAERQVRLTEGIDIPQSLLAVIEGLAG